MYAPGSGFHYPHLLVCSSCVVQTSLSKQVGIIRLHCSVVQELLLNEHVKHSTSILSKGCERKVSFKFLDDLVKPLLLIRRQLQTQQSL